MLGDRSDGFVSTSPGPLRFGMHEDYDYYVNCKLRYRNMGLFTADQVTYSSPLVAGGGEGGVKYNSVTSVFWFHRI